MLRPFALLALFAALPTCGEPTPEEDLAATVLTQAPTEVDAAASGGAPDIPPLRPGELQPLATTGSGLQVLYAAPQGEQRSPSQVAVIFDRPMVPLSALEQDVPLRCTPSITGRARWAGTSTAVIVPDGYEMPAATEYVCGVAKGTAAADGTALDHDVSFRFSTERPALRRSWPSDSEEQWKPEDPMILRFNQKVEPAVIARHLTVKDQEGNKVAVKVQPGTGTHDKPDTVEVIAKLKRDTGYALTLEAGLVGAEGPLAMEAASTVYFRTFPSLRVDGVDPEGTGVDPEEGLSMEFTTPVPGTEVAKHLSLTPPPPDGWKPGDGYTSRYWSYPVRLLPQTTYTATLTPGMKDEHGQVLAEGKTWTFTTGDLGPTLDVPTNDQDLYAANNPPELPIKSRNVSRVDATVERLDPATLLFVSDGADAWREAPGLTRSLQVLAGPPTKNRSGTSMLDLSPVLKDGFGLLRVTSSAPEYQDYSGDPWLFRSFLQVTDLGTTLKLMPDGVLVWVTRLSDGAPVADAEVVLAHDGKQVWAGRTDADGVAIATGDLVPDGFSNWGSDVGALVRSGSDASVTWLEWRDGLYAWSRGIDESFDARQDQVDIELFADRGVYRTGDTVHVAVTARIRDRELRRAPKPRAFTWELTGPEGETVSTGEGKFDEKGGASFDVVPPKEGSFGDYGVRVMSGEDTGWMDVPVRAYRPPAFRVDLAPPTELRPGDTLSATVNARYLFGAPMSGEAVKWSVRRSPVDLAFDEWSAFSFASLPSEDMWSEGPSMDESLSSGDGRLGKDGTYVVTQAIPKDLEGRSWTYTAEATVTDTDRQQVSNRTSANVYIADVLPGVRSTSWLGTVGTASRVEVVAVRPDGQIVAGQPAQIDVLRRTWDSVQERGMDGYYHWVNNAKDTKVGEGKVTVGTGATAWSFVPEQAGYHVLRVTTKDRSGQVATAEADVYVVGAGVAWARSDDNDLKLVADKARYQPGETARILVKAPRAGMRALVTVEREGVYTREVRTLSTTADAVPVKITPEMMPNAFVSVMVVDPAGPQTAVGAPKPGVWFGQTELRVDARGQRAEVVLRTERDTYQPREEVKVTLEAKVDGKPLADAHVVLWASDHGVLSLTNYQTPDLHERFYRPRALSVLTADNRLSVYDRAARLAKGAPVGGGGGGLESDVRTKFETTPIWLPNLRTDKDGRLSTSFPLPDNLTTFRVMATVAEGPAFGKAEHEIRVSRPLIARPALPRFFRDGDRALAGVVVHNNTAEALTVEVKGNATGATLGGSPRTVTVEAGGAKEVAFAITEFTRPDLKFRFDARGGAYADAVEVGLPVTPVVVNEVVATSGVTQGTATEDIQIPQGAVPTSGGLEVDVSASAVVGMGSALDYLIDYPHGCIEQTGSRVRVAMMARKLGDRAGVSTPKEKLDDVVKVGLERMRSFRVPGGGMSYWPGDPQISGPATTYAMTVYSEAKNAGYDVSSAELDELAAVLRRYMAGSYMPWWWSEATRAQAKNDAAAALARAGRGDPAFNQVLYDKRALLPLYGRALMAETIARTSGKDGRVAALTKELESAAYVEASQASLTDKDARMWSALWYGDELGTTNFVRALLVSDPKHPLLDRFVKHLVGARKQGRWSNTYTTASTLSALSEYVDRFEKSGVAAKLDLNGAQLWSSDLGVGGTGRVAVPMANLKSGPLLLSSTNGGRLYYEARVRYAGLSTPARDEGFTLTRDLAVIEGTGAGRVVTPGAMLRVTLRVVTPVDRYDVALVDALPAGLEPVDSFFATTQSDLSASDEGGTDTAGGESPRWWSSWIFNRREIRDEEMRFYASYMPAGIHSVSYVARATTPGEYTAPGARVEEMYHPERYGRTEAGRFIVGLPVASR